MRAPGVRRDDRGSLLEASRPRLRRRGLFLDRGRSRPDCPRWRRIGSLCPYRPAAGELFCPAATQGTPDANTHQRASWRGPVEAARKADLPTAAHPAGASAFCGVGAVPQPGEAKTSRRAPGGLLTGPAAICAASFLVLQFFKVCIFSRGPAPPRCREQTKRSSPPRPVLGAVAFRGRPQGLGADDVASMPSRRRGCVARDDRSSGTAARIAAPAPSKPEAWGGSKKPPRYASWSGPA